MGLYDSEELFLKLLAGTKIHVVINKADYPRANVIFFHGMGENIHRYDQLTAQLLKRNFNVIRYDQPSHGQSDGNHGDIEDLNLFTAFSTTVINYVKERFFDLATFMMGHSMGGFATLMTITKYPGLVDGAIACSPFSLYHQEMLGPLPVEGDPHAPFSGIKVAGNGGVHRDSRLSIRNGKDHTNVQATNGTINTTFEGALFLRDHLQEITDPLFLIHGVEDGLISYRDTMDVFNGVGTRDRELHIYPFLMHATLNDPSRNNDIVEEVDHWITRRLY